MLSILIPIHNFDVRDFVAELSKQSEALEMPIEILCLDDASDQAFVELNRSIAQLSNVTFSIADRNLGRSAARNRLVELSQGDLLLFLDCDGKVLTDDYLKRYLNHIASDVVYGGRVYQEDRPVEANLHFHWYCGTAKEEVPAELRIKTPYKSFMTNNFLVKRSVYLAIKMDETVEGYGHEDTLFAAELRKNGFGIDHIDNPIEHLGIEDTDVFLAKSKNAVKNLALLMKKGEVSENVTLVRYFYLLERWRLLKLLRSFVFGVEGRIIRNLKSPAPNLLWFDLWKLAHLSMAYNQIERDASVRTS